MKHTMDDKTGFEEPMRRPMKPVQIVRARDIAEQFGYDQVVIIARRVGEDGGEHVTTYGRDKENCDVAARAGEFLKFKVMGWVSETRHED